MKPIVALLMSKDAVDNIALERFAGDYGRWEQGLEDLRWPDPPGDRDGKA